MKGAAGTQCKNFANARVQQREIGACGNGAAEVDRLWLRRRRGDDNDTWADRAGLFAAACVLPLGPSVEMKSRFGRAAVVNRRCNTAQWQVAQWHGRTWPCYGTD
jgi:hypothetical protein